MDCVDCERARQTSGRWLTFTPACLWCGARLIQQLGRLGRPQSEIVKRRQQVLKDWTAHGHPEQELRALAKSALPLAPSPSPSKPSTR